MSSPLATHLRGLRRNFPKLQAELARKVLAVEAANFHNENFRAQRWTETGSSWPARKDQDGSRSLLVKSGRLRRTATRGRTAGNVVTFTMPLYGKVHNEGGRAGRGSGFRMPKRQFLGASRILNGRVNRKAALLIKHKLNTL